MNELFYIDSESDLIKARGHKYVKRTGSPGSYRYWYKMPDGSIQEGDADQQKQGRKEHAHRLLLGRAKGHHEMTNAKIAEHTGYVNDAGSPKQANDNLRGILSAMKVAAAKKGHDREDYHQHGHDFTPEQIREVSDGASAPSATRYATPKPIRDEDLTEELPPQKPTRTEERAREARVRGIAARQSRDAFNRAPTHTAAGRPVSAHTGMKKYPSMTGGGIIALKEVTPVGDRGYAIGTDAEFNNGTFKVIDPQGRVLPAEYDSRRAAESYAASGGRAMPFSPKAPAPSPKPARPTAPRPAPRPTARPTAAEVDPAITRAGADALSSLSIKNVHRTEVDPVETHSDGTISRAYRAHHFFTPREGEEDDDNPDFTGGREAQAEVERKLGPAILEKFKVSVGDAGEKSWMNVTLTPKPAPAAPSPAAASKPAASDKAAKLAALRSKLSGEHGINLEEAQSADRASEVATQAREEAKRLAKEAKRSQRESAPTTPAAKAVHAADPLLASDDAPITEMIEAQARGENPYLKRAIDIYQRTIGYLKPERKAIAEGVWGAINKLNAAGTPLTKENLTATYKELTGKRHQFDALEENFGKSTYMSLSEEIMPNTPINPEIERMKRGYGRKQFARMKPHLKDSWVQSHPNSPPPFPTFGDVKSWTEHGGAKPSWAGSTRLSMPKEVYDATHKGRDGKPKYPPAWMPIHMMPAWNYIMKKVESEPSLAPDSAYQARDVRFKQDQTPDLGAQATQHEGIAVAALRKYVQMRGGAQGLTDIPSGKLSEVGLSHADIFKAEKFDQHDLSDATLKKIIQHKIVDPIALSPFIDAELSKKTKKSWELVIDINKAAVDYSDKESIRKAQLIKQIQAKKGKH